MENLPQSGQTLKVCNEDLFGTVIGCAIEVHKSLGPGLLESAYELALFHELQLRDVKAERQVAVPLEYKGRKLGTGFRADVIVESSLLIELKSVHSLEPIHTAQMITYLKLLGIKRGLIMNFNSMPLKNGIKRVSI